VSEKYDRIHPVGQAAQIFFLKTSRPFQSHLLLMMVVGFVICAIP
jgi:hypothetical protein